MAIKRSAEAPKAALNIEQITDLFLKYNTEKKEIEKKEKAMKEAILAYAKDNEKKFEGTTLKFDNGVYVEKRKKLKSTFDEDKLDVKWLENFINAGYGEMISIKFDDKEIVDYAAKIQELDDIDYTLEIQEILAVCTVK